VPDGVSTVTGERADQSTVSVAVTHNAYLLPHGVGAVHFSDARGPQQSSVFVPSTG
jgi:hypothetical protein